MKLPSTLTVLFLLTFSFTAFSQQKAETPDTGEEINVKKAEKNEAPVKAFKEAATMPLFPGCEEIKDSEKNRECAQIEMLKFVYSNLRYPPEARENGVQGTVVIRFIVEKDGSISNAEVTRDPGAGLGEEALRVVQNMPLWHPATTKDGNPVSMYYSLPVKFKLDNRSR